MNRPPARKIGHFLIVAVLLPLTLMSAPSKSSKKGSEQQLTKKDHRSGMAKAVCGNTICEKGETSASCLIDCDTETCCGDGNCHDPENVGNCRIDCCASQTPIPGSCGNGICECWEFGPHQRCDKDCRPGFCGNGLCEPGEEGVCITDCGEYCPPPPPPETCGNGTCEASELFECCPDCFCPRYWTIQEAGVRPVDMERQGEFIYLLGETYMGEESGCQGVWIRKIRLCRGEEVWTRTFNGDRCSTRASGLSLDSAGNVHVVGYYKDSDASTPSYRTFVRKYSSTGVLDVGFSGDGELLYPLSSFGFGDENEDKEWIGRDIAVASTGDIFIAGVKGFIASDASGGDRAFLLKILPGGGLPWSAPVVYPATEPRHAEIRRMVLDEEGNPLVTGVIQSSSDAPYNFWIGKFSFSSGALLNTYLSPLSEDPSQESLGLGIDFWPPSRVIGISGVSSLEHNWPEPDGGDAFYGLYSNFFSTSIDPVWNGTFDSDTATLDWATDIEFSSNPSNLYFVVGGTKGTSSGSRDAWVKKYELRLDGTPPPPLLWETTLFSTDASKERAVSIETDDSDSVYFLVSLGGSDDDVLSALSSYSLLLRKYTAGGEPEETGLDLDDTSCPSFPLFPIPPFPLSPSPTDPFPFL